MKTLELLAALGIGLGSQACAPPEWADFPNEDESILIQDSAKKLREATPETQVIIRHSQADFVDLYGEETTREQFAEDLAQIPDLLDWFVESNRILVADLKDFPDQDAEALYRTNTGRDYNNDWVIMSRESLDDPEKYAHEIAHAFSPWHTGPVQALLDKKGEDVNDEEVFEVGMESGDPAYPTGAMFKMGMDLDEELEAAEDRGWAERIDCRGRNLINDGYSPQEAYDRLYKDYYPNSIDDVPEHIDWGHYSNYYEFYDVLKMSEDDYNEMVLSHKPFITEYIKNILSGLDEFASNYPDNEITTIQEREEEKYKERKVTDLDGYRPRKLR